MQLSWSVRLPLAVLLVCASGLTACKKGPLSSSCDAGDGIALLFQPKSGTPKDAAPRVAEAASLVRGAHVVPSTERIAVFFPNQFNDLFVVLQAPPPPGAVQGNVTFDGLGDVVGVNISFLSVCSPQAVGSTQFACIDHFQFSPNTVASPRRHR